MNLQNDSIEFRGTKLNIEIFSFVFEVPAGDL